MNDIPKTGVFLCKCGQKIEPFVDLSILKNNMTHQDGVECCDILPYPCLEPGLKHIIHNIREKGLNRLIVAGCESRLMLKKFETQLEAEGLKKGQIDIVNLRGHVANVSDLSPEQKAEKGIKLVKASVAEMTALKSSIQQKIDINNPPIIVGGGIASFTAAQELARKGIDCLLSLPEDNPDTILKNIHKQFPGERSNYDRLRIIINDVKNSPHVKTLPQGELCELSGITGDYTLSYTVPEKTSRVKYNSGAIIACLDGELSPPGPEFGYDGKTVLCQTDFEEQIWCKEIPKGNMVFWISDYESGQQEFAQLSARSAWEMSRHILENSKNSRVVIMYNEQMSLPLSAQEMAVGRKLGLIWVPYDKSVQPILQAGYITFGSINDHLEHEIPWDRIILSPIRKLGEKSLNTAKILGIIHGESEFLGIHHAKVRPEMVGREETYLAGSARYACNLNDVLNQGRKAGKKNAEMMQKSAEGKLFAPRVVCIVDTDKCVGCGQCQELCDCNGIGVIEGIGGGLPRVVDPMVCTGGGTCAASCPYQALTLQNNTTDQREARVASLASQLSNDEFVAFACSWAGLPAADNAGNRGLKYNPGIHIIGVPCVGQIDTSVMARAFLEGSPGLLLIGCVPEDCHHSFGVDHAWSRVNLMKKLFTLCGFERGRIALAHADLNRPEEFIHTVESFSRMMKTFGGGIEKTPENQSKLRSIYRLVKYNSRVRLLLSSGLRRPWEKTYRGDQRFALAYDKSDFMEALKEEFLKARLEDFLISEKKPLGLQELADAVSEDNIREQLDELITEGIINRSYKKGKPFYISVN
jgi:coenzyme F420-reducing hydrogenase delta subunit/ferredoxin